MQSFKNIDHCRVLVGICGKTFTQSRCVVSLLSALTSLILAGCASITPLENHIREFPLSAGARDARDRILDSAGLPSPWDEVAAALALFEDIDGARFDDVAGRLEIWGPSSDPARVSMPPLLFDDFVVALSVIGEGRAPGVSIGTFSGRIPTQQDIDRMLRTRQMPIEYIPPSTEDTHMGSVLYEVDRRLKGLAQGEDNITHEKLVSSVPGYRPVPSLLRSDLSMKPGDSKPLGLWWFVPDKTGVAVDGYAMKFASYRMRVEYRALTDDPAVKQFGAHLSEHFERYAREQVLFRELVRLHKLVQLARWYRESGFPVSHFSTYPLRRITTPRTTPMLQSLVSSHKVPGPQPGSYSIRNQFIIGGVDLSPGNMYVPASVYTARDLAPGAKMPGIPIDAKEVTARTSPPRYRTLPKPPPVPAFAAPVVSVRHDLDSYGWTTAITGRHFTVVSIPAR